MNSVGECRWTGDLYLPHYENLTYDEFEQTPSLAYLVGFINKVTIPICLDTGAGKSLMSQETWEKINLRGELKLKSQVKGFEAVNGSRISCMGSAIIKVMIMGEHKNYVVHFQFFVVDALSVEALLGIDEIHRHKIRINTEIGFACHDKVGKLLTNLLYKTPYDFGTIQTENGETENNYKKTEKAEGGKNIRTKQKTCKSNTKEEILTVGVLQVEDEGLEMRISIEPDEMFDSCEFGLDETDISQQERTKAKELLMEFKDLFMWGDGPLTCAHKYEHEIRLVPGAEPVRHKTRRFSVDQQKLINEEVEKLLRQGVIEKSNSPWCSRIVLAWNQYKKKYRVCLDLRDLNARSMADSYPIPNLQDLLNKLAGNKFYTTLDLYAGFHQYNLKKSCREYTAFQTPSHGLVHYVRVPFGAKTAPNGFERLMEEILGDLHGKYALVFIDDVCIFSETVDEGLRRLRAVFERLRAANMKLRPTKCKLLQVRVEYLGSVVSKDGISVAKHIIDAVVDFKTPTNPKSVMRFAGLANFYRDHIKNFAEIMFPLVQLTKKGVKWNWGEDCEEAFNKMKACLTTAPVRCFIDFNKPIVLSCDASAVGIGSILYNLDEQGRHQVIAYGSKTLKGPELNWNVTEKELYAIFFFVRKFKHFLGGRKFIVQSDHNALKYISGARDSTGKITRMLNYLQGFDFEIHHISGARMEEIGPDILSRAMLPIDEQPHDTLAKKLERPVLKLNPNFSPFFGAWFSIVSPDPSYFDSDGELILNQHTLGYSVPVQQIKKEKGADEQLYGNIKRLLKKEGKTKDTSDAQKAQE